MIFDDWWARRSEKSIPVNIGTDNDYEFMREIWEAGVSSAVQLTVMPGGEDEDGKGWRRVEDELPPDGEIVFGLIDGLVPEIVRHYDVGWLNRETISKKITHWMPLPSSPEA